MSKVVENTITKRQYVFILISAVVGIGILSAPNSICQKSEQSGWISMLLGCIYPLIITFCAYVSHKNMGFIDFYTLNQKSMVIFYKGYFYVFYVNSFYL
ncbi:GerAB/ArcD/ProY family transporter [Caloramator sp. mosi_1]|uniref:GerAB/ArcD/ProY family transporter n=1 Tax=Caloramator sp. mosi_1 TaxID=3023090 RepID=UPI00235E2A56|nr:GerAB/ArcD/ProY family transporter [Caloramator sp. mosi_1]WDC84444.1 GerAB/ArcD/ProY family transporter [Caloramator sp. mosi_1]